MKQSKMEFYPEGYTGNSNKTLLNKLYKLGFKKIADKMDRNRWDTRKVTYVKELSPGIMVIQPFWFYPESINRKAQCQSCNPGVYIADMDFIIPTNGVTNFYPRLEEKLNQIK